MTSPSLAHTFSISLLASADRFFRALTDPAELQRWFADHAEVDLPGGVYRFHGPAVLGTPTEGSQQLLGFEPGTSLRYRWSIHGVETEVGYRIAPDAADSAGEQKCTLHITHDVYGQLPFASPKYAIDDLWRLITGNLRSHLAADPNVVLPDFTRDTAEVVVSIEIAATPAKVFRTLLDPVLMARWLGSVARVNLETREYSYGMSYEIEGKPVQGGPTRILELVPDEKLVTDWPDWRGDLDKPKTHVTWALASLPPDGRRTRLTLTHAGFAHPVERSDYQQGWGYFLDAVRGVAEADE